MDSEEFELKEDELPEDMHVDIPEEEVVEAVDDDSAVADPVAEFGKKKNDDGEDISDIEEDILNYIRDPYEEGGDGLLD